MQYLEFHFTLTPSSETAEDVLSALLCDIGFDTFARAAELDIRRARPEVHAVNPEAPSLDMPEDAGQYLAYIPAAQYDADALRAVLDAFPMPGVRIEFSFQEMEDKDWNEEWERHYFQPIVIGGRCCVASTFHKDIPKTDYLVRINPQMSFGTGHHATTSLMMQRILGTPMAGRRVLDMGCGTGILGILACMCGATECVGIDVDEWCVKNSLENLSLNRITAMDVRLGSAETLECLPPFDVILANINRNILLRDLPAYAAALKPQGVLFMSGFYEEDATQIQAAAAECGLTPADVLVEDGWACVAVHRTAAR